VGLNCTYGNHPASVRPTSSNSWAVSIHNALCFSLGRWTSRELVGPFVCDGLALPDHLTILILSQAGRSTEEARDVCLLGHVQWRDTKTVLQAQETTKRLYCTMEYL
jgi:hypothetical protein